jgi:hypothetical protein
MSADDGRAPLLDFSLFIPWVNGGERGLSSEAILYRLTGILLSGPYHPGTNHPADPSDFRRCELLLRQVPLARLVFPAMRDVSPTWARFVSEWDDLVALAEEEVPGVFTEPPRGRSAPRLYARMQDIRYPTRAGGAA